MKKPLLTVIRAFFLILLFAIIKIDVLAQENVTFVKGGFISQGGPKGFQLGINLTKDSYYFTRGFSFETSGLFQDGQFYVSPRAGYEWQIAIVAAAIEISYYRDNLYFVPQVGLTYFSRVDILIGYNFKILGENDKTKLKGLFFSTTINLNLGKRGFQKVGG